MRESIDDHASRSCSRSADRFASSRSACVFSVRKNRRGMRRRPALCPCAKTAEGFAAEGQRVCVMCVGRAQDLRRGAHPKATARSHRLRASLSVARVARKESTSITPTRATSGCKATLPRNGNRHDPNSSSFPFQSASKTPRLESGILTDTAQGMRERKHCGTWQRIELIGAGCSQRGECCELI